MLLESKSLLAKLMATENLVIEQRKVSTAMFDTKNRVLIVPVLDKNIPAHTYDLFMGHEVGHALWTPPNNPEIREKFEIPHSLANIVEDSRIERKIKYKYPGLKHSFVKGYSDLFERNFFGTQGVELDTLNFIDRINLHCKGGAMLNISFTDEERELLREVESTDTYDDVMSVCRKIIDFLKNSVKEQPKVEPTEMDIKVDLDSEEEFEPSEEESEGEDGENETSEEGSKETEDELEGKTVDSTEKTEESEEESEKDGTEQQMSERGGTQSEEDISDLLESKTDEAYRENEHKLFSDSREEITYANVPKLKLEEIIIDHKRVYDYYDSFANKVWMPKDQSMYDTEGFKAIREEIKAGVSYLVKEFEMRKSADQLKKATPAKTGDLNMNKIYSYTFNEDIFKKVTVMPGAKSHGLVIFVDWSGSMTSHLQNTIKQLFNIVMFCKKVNIPYEVYTFTNPAKENFNWKQTPVNGDLVCNDFVFLNVLSSRMNAAQFTKAASALVYMSNYYNNRRVDYLPYCDLFTMNGTPLNNSIIGAMEIIPWFQKKNNLQVVNTIFLTDGDSDASIYVNSYDPNRGGIYEKSVSRYNYSISAPNTIYLRDPVTKHQEKIDLESNRSSTAAFIKLLKYRANCNIIGFYILSPSDFKSYVDRQFHKKGLDSQDVRSEFSKNHCAVIKNEGFDEYYLLRSKRGDSEEPELVVKENATTKGLANAFVKYNNKRSTNRIVLNRFVNLIA